MTIPEWVENVMKLSARAKSEGIEITPTLFWKKDGMVHVHMFQGFRDGYMDKDMAAWGIKGLAREVKPEEILFLSEAWMAKGENNNPVDKETMKRIMNGEIAVHDLETKIEVIHAFYTAHTPRVEASLYMPIHVVGETVEIGKMETLDETHNKGRFTNFWPASTRRKHHGKEKRVD